MADKVKVTKANRLVPDRVVGRVVKVIGARAGGVLVEDPDRPAFPIWLAEGEFVAANAERACNATWLGGLRIGQRVKSKSSGLKGTIADAHAFFGHENSYTVKWDNGKTEMSPESDIVAANAVSKNDAKACNAAVGPDKVLSIWRHFINKPGDKVEFIRKEKVPNAPWERWYFSVHSQYHDKDAEGPNQRVEKAFDAGVYNGFVVVSPNYRGANDGSADYKPVILMQMDAKKNTRCTNSTVMNAMRAVANSTACNSALDSSWERGPRGLRGVADAMADVQPVLRQLKSSNNGRFFATGNGSVGPDGGKLYIFIPASFNNSYEERELGKPTAEFLKRKISQKIPVTWVEQEPGGFKVATGIAWD